EQNLSAPGGRHATPWFKRVFCRLDGGVEIFASGVRAPSDQLAGSRVQTVKGLSSPSGYPLTANEVVEDHFCFSAVRTSSRTFSPSSISSREMFSGGLMRIVLRPHGNRSSPRLNASTTMRSRSA